MWYFAWILGSALASSFAILSGLWLELSEKPVEIENAASLDL